MSRAFVTASFESLAGQLADVGRHCYERGWALGTSGNFSAVVRKEPLTLAITTSGVDKGLLEASHIVEIDARGRVLQGSGTPSAEATVHLAIVRARGAGAVLHTHSIWSTILSDAATESCSKWRAYATRSEEHTSELQSRVDLVCRLRLEK